MRLPDRPDARSVFDQSQPPKLADACFERNFLVIRQVTLRVRSSVEPDRSLRRVVELGADQSGVNHAESALERA